MSFTTSKRLFAPPGARLFKKAEGQKGEGALAELTLQARQAHLGDRLTWGLTCSTQRARLITPCLTSTSGRATCRELRCCARWHSSNPSPQGPRKRWKMVVCRVSRCWENTVARAIIKGYLLLPFMPEARAHIMVRRSDLFR